jgi:hypothetical protein
MIRQRASAPVDSFCESHRAVGRPLGGRNPSGGASPPLSHAAVGHAVSWGRARRAEHAFLAAWDRARPNRRPGHLGVDEIQRSKGLHLWTVLSDLVRGEVIRLQKDRSEDVGVPGGLARINIKPIILPKKVEDCGPS